MQRIIVPPESVELLTRALRVLNNCGGMVSSYADGEADFHKEVLKSSLFW